MHGFFKIISLNFFHKFFSTKIFPQSSWHLFFNQPPKFKKKILSKWFSSNGFPVSIKTKNILKPQNNENIWFKYFLAKQNFTVLRIKNEFTSVQQSYTTKLVIFTFCSSVVFCIIRACVLTIMWWCCRWRILTTAGVAVSAVVERLLMHDVTRGCN